MSPPSAPTAHGEPLDTEVAIETPEHIVFHYRVAGPARRAAAYLVDLIICYTAVVVVGFIVIIGVSLGSAATMGGSVDQVSKAGIGVLLVLLFLAQWGYFTTLEALRGASPGKSALGLRVVTLEGRPIGFGASLLRNLLRAADALPFGYIAGVVSISLTSRFQRVGDLVAGTMVVRTDRAAAARPIVLRPPATPLEMREIPDEVRLDPEERAAFELFLRRDFSMGPARRDELAGLLSDVLLRRFGIRRLPPARAIALLYDQAISEGRGEAPVSSRGVPPSRGAPQWR
jgi:uncharacterized RDD family membrane protein YckC